LMELAHLKQGDELNLEVHEGGTITLTPVRKAPSKEVIAATIQATMKDYARTMRKLA